jgi:hypothetical protein
MQTFPLKLAGGESRTITAVGNLFVYESGDASNRCNLLGCSEEFDNINVWLRALVTITPNSVSGPDGVSGAEKIVGTAGYWWVQQRVGAKENTPYTASVWLRAPVDGPAKVYVNDQAGAVIKVLVCDLTSDWKRFSVPVVTPAGTTAVYVRIGHDVAKEVHVTGAMLERAETMGAYIPSFGPGPSFGAGETRIRVKPDTGDEIVLRPGQRFRPEASTTSWGVTAYGQESIDGAVIVGRGDFDDANTKNSIKLDASFANSVTVTNDTKNRVPVALDPSQLLQILTQEAVMAYTDSITVNLSSGATAIMECISPAKNINGVIIEQATGLYGNTTALLAKATKPDQWYDGTSDLLVRVPSNSSSECLPFGKRIKVPAGKGVYAALGTGTAIVSLLYTVL